MSTHVVLCFDDPQIARMISCRLMRADFEVHSVHDASDACDVLKRVRPHLLVTNCNPLHAELLRQAHDYGVPVLGLTPLGRLPRDINDLCRLGFVSAVLPLPCSLHRLVELARHITQHEPNCALAPC